MINKKYKTFKQIGRGSFHYEKDLPTSIKNWSQNIYKTVVKFDDYEKSRIKDKLKIIDKVENTRKNNNINWMDLVRTSLKSSSDRTLEILDKINIDDKKISKLFKDLNK